MKYFMKFSKVLILAGILTVGAAFGKDVQAEGWKQAGRAALLNIPAPADTRSSLHSISAETYLRSFSRNKNFAHSAKQTFKIAQK